MPAEKGFVNWGMDKYGIRIMGTGEWDLATGLWHTEYEVRSVLRMEQIMGSTGVSDKEYITPGIYMARL